MNNFSTTVLCLTLPCLMTTLGGALIFFFKTASKRINSVTIGLAAGIMLSASIWSLLVPALESAEEVFLKLAFLPVAVGFILGGMFMVFLDFFSSQIFKHKNAKNIKILKNYLFLRQNFEKNYIKNDIFYFCNNLSNKQSFEFSLNKQKEKAFKLFAAITIHNIPEGLSVGFAVGTAVATNSSTISALIFAIGIALQNFPEGLATALPIQTCIKNKKKSFFLAFLSGFVEPIFAILGYFLATYITNILCWLLAFSAGAMIYVIVEEMIPEIHTNSRFSFGTWAFVIGFVIMMLLDICL